jgi:hypothetical protein
MPWLFLPEILVDLDVALRLGDADILQDAVIGRGQLPAGMLALLPGVDVAGKPVQSLDPVLLPATGVGPGGEFTC